MEIKERRLFWTLGASPNLGKLYLIVIKCKPRFALLSSPFLLLLPLTS